VAGRVFLPHLYSQPVNQSRLARTRKTPPQLPSPHPWDFPTELSNSGFPSPLHPNRSPPQRQTRLLYPPSLSLRPLASPPSPTSRSQILLMTNLPPTPQSQPHMRPSTSKTGTSKFCAGTHCSVYTLASCLSTLLHFVGCSLRPTWLRQNHPTVVLVFRHLTRQRISPHSSRRYISPGRLSFS